MKKLIQFLKDAKTEVAKVIWPTRYDTIRYTVAVVIFSVIIAAILGAADFGLLQGFQALIK